MSDHATDATFSPADALRKQIANSYPGEILQLGHGSAKLLLAEIERLTKDLAYAQHIVENRQTAAEVEVERLRARVTELTAWLVKTGQSHEYIGEHLNPNELEVDDEIKF